MTPAPDGERTGRFIRTQKLGAGGMGEVWKAWDPQLDRWVALKLIKSADADELARFQREAQLAGKLSHPNIAATYEIAAHDGVPFIAMQYIDGATLRSRRGGPLRELAALVRDAARAVAYAHEQGVIHRDLKPDNVMLDTQGRPFVMDFGLARPVEGQSGLTVSGLVIGTPSYMPPEQARGERADERADVYSLGATLYDLVTGRPPCQGGDLLSTLAAVVSEDPPPPRRLRPEVDPELETVILKCLEKDPVRRYATAAGFADDLDRWLRGESVAAQRSSVLRLLQKAMARRKGAWIAGLVAFAAVGAVAGTLLYLRARATGQVATAREDLLREMRRTSESCLQAALEMRRLDNSAGVAKYVKDTIAVCKRVIDVEPGLAEPHALLARIHRVAGHSEQARNEADRSVELDPSYVPGRIERAKARADRHRRRRLIESHLDSASHGVSFVEGESESEREARLLVEEDLASLASAAVSPADAAYVAGIRESLAGRVDDAIRHLERALELDPSHETAVAALVMIEADAGRHDAAEQRLTAALQRDPGCSHYWRLRGQLRVNIGIRRERLSQDGDPAFTAAVFDFDEALKRVEQDASFARDRGTALINAAVCRRDRGRPFRAIVERAISDIDAAVAAVPAFAELRVTAGRLRLIAASLLPDDAVELRAKAFADLDEAVRLAPDSPAALIARGHEITRSHVGDEALFKRGLADLERARELQERHALARFQIADAWSARGLWLMNLGKPEAADAFQRAVASYREALDRAPGFRTAWLQLAMVLGHLAELAGGDDAAFAESEALFAKALESWPGSDVYRERGHMRNRRASALRNRGGDSAALFASAVADVEEAVRLEPGVDRLWRDLADLLGRRAVIGVPVVETDRDRALEAAENACRINPTNAPNLACRAIARTCRARLMTTGWEAEFEAAERDFAESLRLNPAQASVHSERALSQLLWGLAIGRTGRDPQAKFEGVIASATEAIRLNPALEGPWHQRGAARFNLCRWRRESRVELLKAAMADYEVAFERPGVRHNLKIREECAMVRFNLAVVLGATEEAKRQYLAAVEDCDVALKGDPTRTVAVSTRAMSEMNLGITWKEEAGRLPRAAEGFEAAIKAEPRNPEWRVRLGRLRILTSFADAREGRDPVKGLEAAIADLTAGLEIGPSDEATYFRGMASAGLADWLDRAGEPAREWYAAGLRDAKAVVDRGGPLAAAAKRIADRCQAWLDAHPE